MASADSIETVFATLKHVAQGNSSIGIHSAPLVDDEDPFMLSSTEIEIRKFPCKIYGKDSYARRVYANFDAMSKYRCVGWVFDSDLDNCMICSNSFGFFNRKHHCRICGDLVCTDCSNGQCLIVEYPQYGSVRACNNCFFGQVSISVWPAQLNTSEEQSYGDIYVPDVKENDDHIPPVAARYIAAVSVSDNKERGEAEVHHLQQRSEADHHSHPHTPSRVSKHLDEQAIEKARQRRESEKQMHQQHRHSTGNHGHSQHSSVGAERVRREAEEAARLHRLREQTHPEDFAKIRNVLSAGTSVADTSPPKHHVQKVSVERELERMMSPLFGTLKMVEQGLGTDSATKTLMSYAEDASGELLVWRVWGEHREMVEVLEAKRGIFVSTGCYAILHRYCVQCSAEKCKVLIYCI
jgi:hypothetical protein